ncbi:MULTISPECIES: hypothetical protein [unclassified Streptomyces]|uniref:hypothetical protein n=1 Tax=unclassified Streptomyces TaxID=2593676 RepID=UPI001F04C746|nr:MULTISPECIES: hypothetical protein [unclassified Streptomyces]MCH0563392.1 hypothetical protein [Streptomyces sp. MUM 2J]MCH0571500.1 hypothetical protein [Streptomyces sp. MUM 136J]
MTGDDSPVYTARYGWDLRTTCVVALSLLFASVLLLPDTPLFARILGLPLFGGGGLFATYVAFSGKVAFRIDETGVLLGGSPARYGATTAHVPWDDITGFVLWRQAAGPASVRYAGVVRREGAPPLPGDGPRSRAVLERLVPVSADVAVSSRAVTGWRLDKERLTGAVAHFAPGVPVHDAL